MAAAKFSRVASIIAWIGLSAAPGVCAADFSEAVKAGDVATAQAMLDRDASLIKQVDAEGKSAMHWAVEKSDIKMVDMLFQHGADHNGPRDKEGRRPIHVAAEKGDVTILDRLYSEQLERNRKALAKGRQPGEATVGEMVSFLGNTFLDGPDTHYQGALFYAVRGGKVDAVKWLLAKGASKRVRNEQRLTPLELAEKLGHKEIAELLRANEDNRKR
jgi:ankyrin repeat protein